MFPSPPGPVCWERSSAKRRAGGAGERRAGLQLRLHTGCSLGPLFTQQAGKWSSKEVLIHVYTHQVILQVSGAACGAFLPQPPVYG